ncbi:hypothetical protein K7X08_022851 [Anisodus acutangulus]|uniref:Uncharacterized protein n=1 Tax=Anisodus acutangulus TaxID=402998 RepID=A0A9Q1MBD0_9SOLA|nr:hypothetical protein K7X08_022851 [Anisodus acutangulus]
MATMIPENLACIKNCNDLSNFELSQENRALLMSLLDETQALDDHDHDDERLTSMIRSLEDEIDQRTMKGRDLFQENNEGVTNFEYKISESNVTDEFNWMEIEMENLLYMETNNKVDHEVDVVSDQYSYGVCLEENNHNTFLWEEQYPQH